MSKMDESKFIKYTKVVSMARIHPKDKFQNYNIDNYFNDQTMTNWILDKKKDCSIPCMTRNSMHLMEEMFKKQDDRRPINVVCSTLHAISGEPFMFRQLKNKNQKTPYMLKRLDPTERKKPFDVVIIDEAGQNFDVECFGAIYRSEHVILVGDNNQLSPVDPDNDSANFKQFSAMSIMDRAIECGAAYETMLTTQYRFNNEIMKWPNQQIYENKLSAGASNAEARFNNLSPVQIYNVKDAKESLQGTSFMNVKEGLAILDYVKFLVLKQKANPKDIGIICTYAGQKKFIKNKLRHENYKFRNIICDSVDGSAGYVLIQSCSEHGHGTCSCSCSVPVLINFCFRT